MALTTATTSSTITVTATDEDLTFDKIKSEINGLSDTNNTCTSKTFVLNKRLVLEGNQSLNLGNNITYQFTGTNRYLTISSNFTSVTSGRLIDGDRVGVIHLTHFGNNTGASQVIISNTVETHLILVISQNNSNYPSMLFNNTHPDSTLKLTVSSIDAAFPYISFTGGWTGKNEVTFETGLYRPGNDTWFNVVSGTNFRLSPFVPYPANGFNYSGKKGKFANINANSSLNGLVSDIGIGTSDYTFHPAFSNRKISFRYNFKFNFTGIDLNDGKLAFSSGGAKYQEHALTGNTFDINNVVLLSADTRGGAGGASDYSQITFEEFNRKTGIIEVRKAGVITQSFAYSKTDGVSGFSYIGRFLADEHYSNTATTLTLISTADELYDLARQAIASDLTLPDDLVTATNKVINIKTGWTLASTNGGSGDVLGINATTKIITAKLDDTGLQKTDKFNALSGTIDPSLDGDTNMNYIKSNGKVPVSLDLALEAGSNSPVFGVWPKSQGLANRTGILTAPAGGIIDVTPGTEMYFVADAVNAYRGEPMAFNVDTFGSALTGSLRRIKKVDGTNLLPDTLLVAQKRIADMMNYNQAAARVDITLPSNYTTDERWDSASNTWTFKSEDFWPLAYKAEQIQSSEGSLIDPSVVTIDNFKFTLSIASSLTFRQDVNNPECVINMNAFIIKRQGDTEQANTFVDHSNGVILVNAGSLIIADVITPAAALTAVVDAIPGKVNESTALTTLNENVIRASKLIPAEATI